MIPAALPFAEQGNAIEIAIAELRRRRRIPAGTIARLESARITAARLADVAAATSDAEVDDLLARASSAARTVPHAPTHESGDDTA